MRTPFARVACFVAIACATSIAHAQAKLGMDSLYAVIKLQPGQSIVRDNFKLVLEQRDAGVRGASGWYLIKSAKGGFSVRLPAPVNEAVFYSKERNGFQIEQNYLLSESGAKKFMLVCTKHGKFLLPRTPDPVQSMVSASESSFRQFKSAHFADATHEGVEYSGINESGAYLAAQSFLLGDTYCNFGVRSSEPFNGIPPEARTAFASFRLLPGPKD